MLDVDACVKAVDRQNYAGMVKIEEDAARYRTVLAVVKPSLIIECGTFSGKSALWMADESGAHVVTMDVSDQVPVEVRAGWGGRVEMFIGSSTSAAALDYVSVAVAAWGGPVMVVLDSDHSHGHVLDEMRKFSRFVTAGSYMVVEDGVLRWLGDDSRFRGVYEGDPLDAIEEWLSIPEGAEWEVDEIVMGMADVTMHPQGFLRRMV